MTLLAPATATGPGPPKPAQRDVGNLIIALPQVEPAKDAAGSSDSVTVLQP